MESRYRGPLISEEIKARSAALADEIAGWPHVSLRALFDFTALQA